ncbi:vWA domain-containing protein [Pseudaestuariivita atlantica]|nr:vWA domain-containing protein [Pseudaestuariivita atlantica]
MIFACIFACLISFPVAAAECNSETESEIRGLRDEAQNISKQARRLSARADGQTFRVLKLPVGWRSSVPKAPEIPRLSLDQFGEDLRPIIVCDNEGNGTVGLDAATSALLDYAEALDAISQTLDARETALVSVEDKVAAGEAPPEAAAPPVVAEADPEAPPQTDKPEAPEVAEPEAPEVDESQPNEAPEVAAPGAVREPLFVEGTEGLYRRAISLPSAQLYGSASEGDVTGALPTFSVLYVFAESSANGKSWLEVGDSLREPPSGWVKVDETLPWSSMLVMQFAPRGKRSRVVFFERETMLADLVNSFSFRNEAQSIYQTLEEEKRRIADQPDAEPNWDRRLVAIEPETAVSFSDQPYLLPILDWRPELFDGTVETTLLKVAAIPATAQSVGTRDSQSFENDAGQLAAEDGELRVGVVFVIDTTVSMRPFLERTYETIERFYRAFEQFESTSFISFGLLGFRDNIKHDNAGIEYVTRMFQPLDPETSPRQILSNMEQMREAKKPTIDFKEDVFAGLIEAIEDNDWTPYDARLIVLVTDASARTGRDPLATYQGETAGSVAQLARDKNIVILPVHLITPTNQRNNNDAEAEDQFRELSQTGDENTAKYVRADATSDERFAAEIDLLANRIAESVFKANSGQLIGAPGGNIELEEIPSPSKPGLLADAAQNEIFRAQLESLSRQSGGDAPSFLAGWASDRDLVDPDVETLQVSVFLTRNQLSTLDKRLDLIVDAFRSGGDDPEVFFDNLQLLAAEMSTDPDAVRADERQAIQTLLPSFLQNLPYKSQVLRLNRDYWSSLSVALRQEFIEQIEGKQTIYANIFDQTSLWMDFGAGDPGLEATAIRLSNLP